MIPGESDTMRFACELVARGMYDMNSEQNYLKRLKHIPWSQIDAERRECYLRYAKNFLDDNFYELKLKGVELGTN